MIDLKVLKKLSQIHVLIVEDDEATSFALRQALGLHCKRVDVAKNGIEGFEMFEQFKPDIVISDINLPEMNGLDMVHAMHEVSPHLPVIIITSYDTPSNISESINEGAYNYLRKPIVIEDLQTSLLMATKDIYNFRVQLKFGFTYDKNSKQLINSNEETVKLTKLEMEILHLLISNIDKIVDYSTIESYAWQEKSMSIEALRMRIKKIRQKTYNDIIENVSGCGYKIRSTH